MKLALFALDIVKIHYTQNRHINEAIAALKERLADPMSDVKAALADQEFILHDEENEGGWTDWICPKPDSYLMKCCDCGLVHEMQTRVANYESRPSEDFVVSSDPDLQAQFRVRRHEVLEATLPAQPAQRTEPLIGCVNHDCDRCKEQSEQEPLAWTDADGNVSDNNDHKCFPIPLYTHPPQRTWVGLTDKDLDYLCHLAYSGDEEFALAVQAKLKEKNTCQDQNQK